MTLKKFRVHEIVNYFYPNEFNGYPQKAKDYGIAMHERIQQRMQLLNPELKAEVELDLNFKNLAIIQGHADLLNVKKDYVVIYEIKPVISWLKYGFRYDMQLNLYTYLTKKLYKTAVRSYYLLYYKGMFRKLPLVFRYSDARIEEFISEFLKSKLH